MQSGGSLEPIDAAECLRLLDGPPIGRVGVTIAALPAVLPVNFALLDGDIVFCTNDGTKLRAAVANAVVAFEVDGYDALYHTGWSVLVQGVASEITNPAEIARADALPLRPWANGDTGHYVRITPQIVSGRRIRHRAAAAASAAATTAGSTTATTVAS